jgi:hypothetical protein
MTIEFDQLEVAGDDSGGGRGRRRVVAGVAAAMLIAAAGGVGYGIGLGVDRDTDAAESGTDTTGGAPADEVAAPTTATTVEEPSGAPTTTPAADFESDDGGSTEAGDTGIRSSGGTGYPAFGSQPMETLFERVTPTGFAFRVQLGQMWDMGLDGDWGAGDWRPAPWCFEAGQLRVSMVGNGVVDVGGVPWYSEPFKGRAVSWVLLGGNDGDPQWVIVAQAPADVTNVRVTFADGSTDSVVPQGGMAVLTAPGELSTPVDEGDYTYWMDPTPSFQVVFEGGAEPVTIDSGGLSAWDDPDFIESCTPPPPALPDAGEQPAEPAAAVAEIKALMASLYGAIDEEVDRSAFIDDPTGVAEAREQVQSGVFADDAASAIATIDELVFTAPDEAWFRYSIDTPGNDFDNRYGIAVVVDGVWKITRSTVCQDLSLAGGDCGGGWEPIYPLGAHGSVDEEFVTASTVLLGD